MPPTPAAAADDRERAFPAHVAAVNVERIFWFMAASLACIGGGALAAHGFWPAWPRGLASGLSGDAAAAAVALTAAIALRRRAGAVRVRQAFAVVVLVALLGVMDFYFFTLLPAFGPTATYAVGVICAGVLLLVPPRWLVPLILANHVVYVLLLRGAALAPGERFIAAVDGSLGVAMAILASGLLYAAKRRDFFRTAELDRQGRALEAANAILRERNAEMNELMAIAAHDLRSPLQGVKHLVEWTGAQPEIPIEQRRGIFQEVARTCGAMLRLVGRLLDAHRAETATSGETTIGDLEPVARESVERARVLGAARAIRCELRGGGSARARHEPAALQQALDNLLANAVKFSPDAGTVTVEIDARDDRCRIVVSDEGPGVPPDERSRLFRKFHRGDTLPASGETGSGLGLFIVRTLIDRMGGTVHHEPRAPRGSAFVITLPRS